jgi:hypothetical protein
MSESGPIKSRRLLGMVLLLVAGLIVREIHCDMGNAIPELKGVLLASNEGLPIAHSLSDGADAKRVAAIAASA